MHHSKAQKVGFNIAIFPGFGLLGAGDYLKQGDLWFNFVEMKFDAVDYRFYGVPCDNYVAIRTLTTIEESEMPKGVWGEK